MNRRDRIKLSLTRNWKFPGRERLAHFLKSSDNLRKDLQNGLTWLNDEPIAIYTTADNYIECCILETGTYEAEIEKLISISLREGDTALDIGANIGLQSLRMARYTGKTGQVLCFEPLPHLQKKLLNNVALNRAVNIKLFPYALSDNSAILQLSVNEQAWNQGTFNIGGNENGYPKQKIIVMVADDLPELLHLTELHMIKIDVEGFELNVLNGLKKTIVKFKPRIIFEYDENYWTRNTTSVIECYELLKEFHYSLFQIYPAGCELICSAAEFKSGNIFCIQQNPDDDKA
ncbi:MAG: FkbM family methyltransferase [Flavobacterium sp.]|nr:FkbM family methyltransferase [Pedobacter sp.]